MNFTVRVYLGDKLIPNDKLKDIVINSPVVNRIVDNAVERIYAAMDDTVEKTHNKKGT